MRILLVAFSPTPPQLDNTMLAFSKPQSSASSTEHEQPSSSSSTPIVGPSGVVNTRSDYYTVPPLDELDSMATVDSTDPIMVENFTVGRHGYGVIFFSGKTNVRYLNLDELGKNGMGQVLTVFLHIKVDQYSNILMKKMVFFAN